MRRRVNLIIYLKCLLIGLLSDGILFALMLALRKFANFPAWLFVFPPLLMAAIAHALAREKWLTNSDAALLIDRNLQTKELVTQALEIESKGILGADGIVKSAVEILHQNRGVSYAGIDFRKAVACVVLPAAFIAMATFIPAQTEKVPADSGSLPVNVKDETVNNLEVTREKNRAAGPKAGKQEFDENLQGSRQPGEEARKSRDFEEASSG